MVLDTTATFGTVVSVVSFAVTIGVVYGRVDARQKAMERAIDRLTEVVEILSHHAVTGAFPFKRGPDA